MLHKELGNPIAARDHDRGAGVKIDQRNLDLAPVTGVDGAWRIHDRQTQPRGQPGARMDQTDHTGGDSHSEAGADEGTMPGFESDVLRTDKVKTGVSGVGAGGQRKPWIKTDYCKRGRHGGTDYP